jgi:hypothetical protein
VHEVTTDGGTEDERLLLSPRQLALLSTAERGLARGILAGTADSLALAWTLVRDGAIERLIDSGRGGWTASLTQAGVTALKSAECRVMAAITRRGSRMSWKQVARLLGARMVHQAQCPTHIGPPVEGCAYCEDRIAYATFAGRALRG